MIRVILATLLIISGLSVLAISGAAFLASLLSLQSTPRAIHEEITKPCLDHTCPFTLPGREFENEYSR